MTIILQNDLISRQAAIDADKLDQFLENAEIEAHYKRKYVLEGAINTLRGNIRTFPTIEPERKTGKWIHMGGDEWCCDQCGNVISTEGSWEHPLSDERKMYHCNICGARMQEGEDNERA